MSFRSHCRTLLCAGALTSLPLAAQNAPRVQHVSVLGSGQAIEVEIRTSTPVTPQSQVITDPDRIVVDFPGALPGAELRAFRVNRGPLQSIRTGLFSANPPITRIVLDLSGPQSYQIFSARNAVMLKVGVAAGSTTARLVDVSHVSNAALLPSNTGPLPLADVEAPPPPKPPLAVIFANGMLTIHAEHSTLAKVLFEVQKQTGADIAIPAGAESEDVAAELGPAPIRDVLVELLNGSRYNFVFVERSRGGLQKVLLTVRDGSVNPQFQVGTSAQPPAPMPAPPPGAAMTRAAPDPVVPDTDVPSEEVAPQ